MAWVIGLPPVTVSVPLLLKCLLIYDFVEHLLGLCQTYTSLVTIELAYTLTKNLPT